MAGFLFSLDSEQSLIESISKGIYSTRLSTPNNIWKIHHEGTFADYSSMQEGDNIYFFIRRKIYGIGVLINAGVDCKYLNYPGANIPSNQEYVDIQDVLLLDIGEASVDHRFVCTFKPSPYFFTQGIDMDEILSSSPSSFKILRAFWKLSFIKFSDEENQAFKNIVLRRNINVMANPDGESIFQTQFDEYHNEVEVKVNNDDYRLSVTPFLSTIANADNSIRHEMAIEAALMHQLSSGNAETLQVFEKWDYISHQVIASPFKPIDYMDKMDIFGYRFIEGQKPTINNYLIIEIKKGLVTEQDVLQLMKYVDWIKNEYTYGDYNMINSFLVGYDFSVDAIAKVKEHAERKFIYGVRPSISATWRNVKLVTYMYNQESGTLDFQILANANEE